MAVFSTLVQLVLLSSLALSLPLVDRDLQCLHPKVRKEWRQLSVPEKTDWIQAINCLGALPHNPKLQPIVPLNVSLIPPVSDKSSFYDDITYIHMDLNTRIHYTGYFLPWHRYYLQFFEDALVGLCGYKGAQPYWDWTIDHQDVYNATLWDDSPSGLGRWGDPNNDFQINSGGFKDQIRAYPQPHHIRRNYSLYPFRNPVFGSLTTTLADYMANSTITSENVAYMVNGFDDEYIDFQAYFEGINGPHPGPHLIMAGDMGGLCPFGTGPPDCYAGPTWTPNDPLFFLHHGMVDKVWHDWQLARPENKDAFAGGSVSVFGDADAFAQYPTGAPPYLNYSSLIPGDGLWENITIEDVMDTQAGVLCYVYE